MTNIFTQMIRVENGDIDTNGHVNNIRYIEWFVGIATAHSDALGVGFDVLQQLQRSWVAKEHHIYYKHGAYLGDELLLKTLVDDVKMAQSTRKYKLSNSKTNQLICEGETSWVFVELESLKPKKIPRELIAKYIDI